MCLIPHSLTLKVYFWNKPCIHFPKRWIRKVNDPPHPPCPNTGFMVSNNISLLGWSSRKLWSCHFTELQGKPIFAASVSQSLESYPPVTIFIWIKGFKIEWISLLEIQMKMQRGVAASKTLSCLENEEQGVFNPGCTLALPKECQKYWCQTQPS